MSSSPSSSSSSDAFSPIGWLANVPCPVDVVLGTAILKVAECARLDVESIVRLRQPVGADAELRVSGIPFATGEIVIVDNGASVRLNRILPPSPEEPA